MFIKPYLLNGLNITHAGQVWCTDITYIPMKHGFMYLTAIIDVYSRKIVGWCISNSMAAEWCKEVLEDAIRIHGKPEIINSDQGNTPVRYGYNTWSSNRSKYLWMVKEGPWINVWIERFWKSLKYDYVYLNPAGDGFKLYEGVQNHIGLNQNKIHHTTRETPKERYKKSLQNAA